MRLDTSKLLPALGALLCTLVLAGVLIVSTGNNQASSANSTSLMTFSARQSTYVTSASPKQVNGAAAMMWVDGSPLNRALIRFRVTGIPPGATIDAARVRLFVTNYSPYSAVVHRVIGPWGQSWTRWANAPKVGARISMLR